MIRNEAELEATKSLLAQAERAYASLRAELLPTKPKMFALISPGYTREIAGLTQAIHEYMGIPTVQLPEDAEIVIRLKGRQVELGMFPAASVGKCLKQFQDGVANIAASRHRESRATARDAKKRCRFPLAGVGPGSVTLYLASPLPPVSLFPQHEPPVADEALDALVQGVQKCTDGGNRSEAELSNFDQNAIDYEVFKAVAGLMPADHGVDSVEVALARRADEISGRVVTVTRDVAIRAKGYADQIAAAGVRVTEVGTIRKMDLDRRTFSLRSRDANPKKSLEGTFPASLYGEFEDLMNGRVKIVGVVTTRGTRVLLTAETVSREPVVRG
ncbi:MAG: hypothetical protein U0871_07430 [Gemmataceae bacterium]